MTNDPKYRQIREQAWRRKLGATQQAELRAWLAAHPEALADWEAELSLSEGLRRLPDAPMPSNFTARVLQAVQRAEPKSTTGRRWQLGRWLRISWTPRLALAAMVLVAGALTYRAVDQKQLRAARRSEIASGMATISEVSVFPSAEALADFDEIRALGAVSAPGPDPVLLEVLK